MHFIAHLPCRSKKNHAGGIPTISHRISHSRLAAAPKPGFSSLEILPGVILGCDPIAGSPRGPRHHNRSSCDRLPGASVVRRCCRQTGTRPLAPSHRSTTNLKSHDLVPDGGSGEFSSCREKVASPGRTRSRLVHAGNSKGFFEMKRGATISLYLIRRSFVKQTPR